MSRPRSVRVSAWPRLTRRGGTLVVVGVLLLAVSLWFDLRDILLLAFVGIAMPAAAGVFVVVRTPRLAVTRAFAPPVVPAGAWTRVSLVVKNRGRRTFDGAHWRDTVPDGLMGPPEAILPAIGPYEGVLPSGDDTVRLEYRLRMPRRGVASIGPLRVGITDPFGLARIDREVGTGHEIVVTPRVTPLEAALGSAASIDGVVHGLQRRSHPNSDELIAREYRYGDPLRRVNWAATARRGELMVREEEQRGDPEARVLLDTTLSGRPRVSSLRREHDDGPNHAFELGIEMAASIGVHLLERRLPGALHPGRRSRARGRPGAAYDGGYRMPGGDRTLLEDLARLDEPARLSVHAEPEPAASEARAQGARGSGAGLRRARRPRRAGREQPRSRSARCSSPRSRSPWRACRDACSTCSRRRTGASCGCAAPPRSARRGPGSRATARASTAARRRTAHRRGRRRPGRDGDGCILIPCRSHAPSASRSTAASFLFLVIATMALGPLISGSGWWWLCAFIAAGTLFSGLGFRAIRTPPSLVPVLELVVLLLMLTLLFGGATSFALIVPTQGTFETFGELIVGAQRTIEQQAVPAIPVPALSFGLALGVGLLAVLTDILVQTLRMPALAAAPALVPILIPGFIIEAGAELPTLVLTAAAYLLLLRIDVRVRRRARLAAREEGDQAATVIAPKRVPIVSTLGASLGLAAVGLLAASVLAASTPSISTSLLLGSPVAGHAVRAGREPVHRPRPRPAPPRRATGLPLPRPRRRPAVLHAPHARPVRGRGLERDRARRRRRQHGRCDAAPRRPLRPRRRRRSIRST